MTEPDDGDFAQEEAAAAFDLIPADSPIPRLYAQEKAGDDAIVYIKLFLPVGAATWYLTEYDRDQDLAFGWAALGLGGDELGYVSVAELRELRVWKGHVRVERDLHWTPVALREVKAGRAR